MPVVAPVTVLRVICSPGRYRWWRRVLLQQQAAVGVVDEAAVAAGAAGDASQPHEGSLEKKSGSAFGESQAIRLPNAVELSFRGQGFHISTDRHARNLWITR
jgi:hypothetical protein